MEGYHDPMCPYLSMSLLHFFIQGAWFQGQHLSLFVPDMLAVLGVILVYSSLDPCPLTHVP